MRLLNGVRRNPPSCPPQSARPAAWGPELHGTGSREERHKTPASCSSPLGRQCAPAVLPSASQPPCACAPRTRGRGWRVCSARKQSMRSGRAARPDRFRLRRHSRLRRMLRRRREGVPAPSRAPRRSKAAWRPVLTRAEASCRPREAAAADPLLRAGARLSRGTMPQPGARPGASCAETTAREAGAAAREGGRTAAGGQPRPPVRGPAEQ